VTGSTARCAHGLRTAAPGTSRRSRFIPARRMPTDLRLRGCLAPSPRGRHTRNGTANAVRVYALPGFKSPSLRHLTSASTEIPDPGGGAGLALN
jgi:hypothetical protein